MRQNRVAAASGAGFDESRLRRVALAGENVALHGQGVGLFLEALGFLIEGINLGVDKRLATPGGLRGGDRGLARGLERLGLAVGCTGGLALLGLGRGQCGEGFFRRILNRRKWLWRRHGLWCRFWLGFGRGSR